MSIRFLNEQYYCKLPTTSNSLRMQVQSAKKHRISRFHPWKLISNHCKETITLAQRHRYRWHNFQGFPQNESTRAHSLDNFVVNLLSLALDKFIPTTLRNDENNVLSILQCSYALWLAVLRIAISEFMF